LRDVVVLLGETAMTLAKEVAYHVILLTPHPLTC
jgi:hypothetical protein